MKTLPFLLLLLTATGFASDPLDSVLSRMDKAAISFKSMTANMKQVSHTAVIDQDNTESGTILLKRPKPHDMHMLVQLSEPDVKTVALQNEKLDIFLPKINTVQEYDLGKSRALIEQFLLLGFGTTRKELTDANNVRFLGEETVNGQKAAKLELVPRAKEVLQHFKKIELWLSEDTGYPAQHKMYQPGGDYMLVTFSDLKVNPAVPDAALKLKLPKGVKKEYPQR